MQKVKSKDKRFFLMYVFNFFFNLEYLILLFNLYKKSCEIKVENLLLFRIHIVSL